MAVVVKSNRRPTVIGCEGETATLPSRCLFTFSGLGGGLAPRQFERYALPFCVAAG